MKRCFVNMQKVSAHVSCGSVVRCPEGSRWDFRGSVLGQDTSEPQPSTGEILERHELCELSP